MGTNSQVQQTQPGSALVFLLLTPNRGDQRYDLILKYDLTQWLEKPPWIDTNVSEHRKHGSQIKTHTFATPCLRLSAVVSNASKISLHGIINGTVELVNHVVLQMLLVLLIKYQLDIKEWPYLLPVVQLNLKHT
ncbi:LOW QUALITY PROTEIN: hypothetical protein PHMEG_00013079 [Phytophthora megakarya]|uniref:Uncharacterized protein n=1 Tax=Phytophthora megakarya TaxID=4795 RepID=A0A225W768_9STRA|nr:LOW QUALITY PROTEIN: hypothetical protein PHMEG_00013079 [Phytophthora megakarya]